jgi:DNA-binding FadR family transcriptional regulator
MNFRPVSRATTAESVAEQILEEIRRGHLRVGDRLPSERELMQAFGVGRSSVREALQILASLNLIETTRGAGAFVRQPAADEIFRADLFGVLISNTAALELIEARQLVEPAAVRLACTRGTEEDFAEIERLLDAHERALTSGESVNEYAARFHVLLARASRNQIITRFMESILELLLARGRKISRLPGGARQEIADHRGILRLVRKRDSEAAEAAISSHIIRSAKMYDVDPVPAEAASAPDNASRADVQGA